MKKTIAGLLGLMFISVNAQALMVEDKKAWSDLSVSEQTGYVIAFIDSYYFVVTGGEEFHDDHPKIRVCIDGMTTDEFIDIINVRYTDLKNYRSPPFFQLEVGIREMCGLPSVNEKINPSDIT